MALKDLMFSEVPTEEIVDTQVETKVDETESQDAPEAEVTETEADETQVEKTNKVGDADYLKKEIEETETLLAKVKEKLTTLLEKEELTLHSNNQNMNNFKNLLFSAEEIDERPDYSTLLFDDTEEPEESVEEVTNEFEEQPATAPDNKSKVKIEVEVPQDPAESNKNKALDKVKEIIKTFHSAGIIKHFDSVEVGETQAEKALDKIAEIIADAEEGKPVATEEVVEVKDEPKVEEPAPAVEEPKVETEVKTTEEPEKPAVEVEETVEDEEWKSPVELVKEANEAKDTDSLQLHCMNQNKRKF